MKNYIFFGISAVASLLAISIFVNSAFAQEESSTNSTAYIQKARDLLKQVSAEYKAGNFDVADNLARTAYLDNFEYVESDLEKNGAGDLKEEIEQMMRIELRDMIKNRAPQENIDTQIAAIDAKLTDAYAKVPEFPLGAILTLTTLVGIVIAVTRRKIDNAS